MDPREIEFDRQLKSVSEALAKHLSNHEKGLTEESFPCGYCGLYERMENRVLSERAEYRSKWNVQGISEVFAVQELLEIGMTEIT